MSAKNCEHYRGKNILAPMVKIGTLPTRLLALRYGADLVYTEEIIDWRLLRSRRVQNEMLGITEFIDDTDGSIVFSTSEEETSKLIFQMGTADADRALRVLLKVQDLISGIDVNMGCPKEFSIKGGMGAALLKKPEKIKDILTTLVNNAKIPVTCKIRVLSTIEETLELALMIQSCGVSALAIHGRNVNERPRHANRNHFIKAVAEKMDIPIIANGGSKEIDSFEDIQKFKGNTGADSVMIARGGINPSIFRKEGKLEMETVIQELLKLSILTDNKFSNTKYTLQCILRELQETPLGKQFLATQTMEELCEVWGVQEFYDQKNTEYNEFRRKRPSPTGDECTGDNKKMKLDNPPDSSVTIVPDCFFIRGHYNPDNLPKSILLKWSKAQGFKETPLYTTQFKDKKFISVVYVGGKKVMTDVFEKNKKSAEQGAALACCRFLKLLPSKES